MGGALAFHTAYRWEPNLAGMFAFSSFLNDNSVVYEELKKSSKNRGKMFNMYLKFHRHIRIVAKTSPAWQNS